MRIFPVTKRKEGEKNEPGKGQKDLSQQSISEDNSRNSVPMEDESDSERDGPFEETPSAPEPDEPEGEVAPSVPPRKVNTFSSFFRAIL